MIVYYGCTFEDDDARAVFVNSGACFSRTTITYGCMMQLDCPCFLPSGFLILIVYTVPGLHISAVLQNTVQKISTLQSAVPY